MIGDIALNNPLAWINSIRYELSPWRTTYCSYDPVSTDQRAVNALVNKTIASTCTQKKKSQIKFRIIKNFLLSFIRYIHTYFSNNLMHRNVTKLFKTSFIEVKWVKIDVHNSMYNNCSSKIQFIKNILFRKKSVTLLIFFFKCNINLI